MDTRDAFVISSTNDCFTLRFRGADGSTQTAPYSPKNNGEHTKLLNAMASTATVTFVWDGRQIVSLA